MFRTASFVIAESWEKTGRSLGKKVEHLSTLQIGYAFMKIDSFSSTNNLTYRSSVNHMIF